MFYFIKVDLSKVGTKDITCSYDSDSCTTGGGGGIWHYCLCSFVCAFHS